MTTRDEARDHPSASRTFQVEPVFDWSLCRTFLAVARQGSIAAATHELGMSHPAIRRQLDRLEKAFGASLFSRSQSGMTLTPLAVALLRHAEEMERVARSMVREASSTETSGLVRIAADGLLCTEVLPSVLATLRTARPGLRYEVMAGTRDLVRRDADVGLHFAAPTQERIVASRVATFEIGLFASRSWIATAGEIEDQRTLARRQALVGRTDASDDWSGFTPSSDGFAVTVTGMETLPFIASGLGVGALPVAVAQRRDDLARVLPEVSSLGEVWLSVHPDLRQVPHVRLVMDALRDRTAAMLT